MAYVPRKKTAVKAKGKKRVAKRKNVGKRSQNSKVDARLTVHCSGQLGIQAGAVANNYVLGYVTAIGITSGVGNNHIGWYQNPDFLQQKALYDEVCITGYTVTFNPVINITGVYDQASQPLALQRQQESFLYSWFDRDGNTITAASTNVPNKLGDYDSFKKHDC